MAKAGFDSPRPGARTSLVRKLAQGRPAVNRRRPARVPQAGCL